MREWTEKRNFLYNQKELKTGRNGGISLKDIFLLVDGNSLMHRAFHALPLMDADGVYTNAVYGFLSMLLKVIKEENVQYNPHL